MAKPSRTTDRSRSAPEYVSPGKIWGRYPPGSVKIDTRMLPGGEGRPSVLIEGNADSLRFLAEVIAAVAADEDCGYELSPTGAGNAFFAKDSEFGIYIHRLPCVNESLRHGASKPRP